MTDANRISLRMEPEMTPVRREEKMDLNAEIKVAVDSHLTGLGVAGVVCIFLGVLATAVGFTTFGILYPGDMSLGRFEAIVITIGTGIVLLFLGASMFFYGRTVLGSGHLDQFTLEEPLAVGGSN